MLWESAWDIGGMLPLEGAYSVRTYVDSRAALGVNGMLVRVLSKRLDQMGNDGEGIRGIALRDGTLPFTTPGDFSTPNEPYFAHYDGLIDICGQSGMLVQLAIVYLGVAGVQSDGWQGQLVANSSSNRQGFGAYLANRWIDKSNVIIVIGGDNTPSGSALTGCQDLLQGYRSVDTSKLWTFHTGSDQKSSNLDASFAADPPDLPLLVPPQLNGCYSWSRSVMDLLLSQAYDASPTRPAFQVEGLYEHNNGLGAYDPSDAERIIVRQGYAIARLLGVGGVVGNERVWPGGEDNPPIVTGYNTDALWQSALDNTSDGNDAGIRDCEKINTAFASHSWQSLIPNGKLPSPMITAESDTYGAFNETSLGAAYTSGGASFTVNLSLFSGIVVVTWVDPTSGSVVPATGSPFSPTGTHAFNASAEVGSNSIGDGDWLAFFSVGGA